MSFITQNLEDQNLIRYNTFVNDKNSIVESTQNFIDLATSFYGDLADAEEKAELLAIKDDLVAQLTVILT